MSLRITKLRIRNFKSLVDFEIELSKFTCLVGLNGSGKSTVLQAIDFLAQLVRGDLQDWFELRRWKPNDIRSKFNRAQFIQIECIFIGTDENEAIEWKLRYQPSTRRCIREFLMYGDRMLTIQSNEVIIVVPGKLDQKYPITFEYQGSILSAMKEELVPPELLRIKHFLQQINSFDLLGPEYLRQRNRESKGTLGLGGQNLSAFLHELGNDERAKLVKSLSAIYPHLQQINVKSLRSGWKQLEIEESYEDASQTLFPSLTTESRHINDGMLRIIAIMAALSTNRSFLLFDEIENGINPELVEFLLRHLIDAKQQILVTTHSPLILNYLPDDIAKSGVIYLYKTSQGHTKSIPFFSIPSIAKKLIYMGPGEAFLDTKLTELQSEIESMNQEVH